MSHVATHQALHALSSQHRTRVEASVRCGCFHCKKFFTPDTIRRWTDGGQTAMCPVCRVDAVLPESGLNKPLTQEILDSMHQVYFLSTVPQPTPTVRRTLGLNAQSRPAVNATGELARWLPVRPADSEEDRATLLGLVSRSLDLSTLQSDGTLRQRVRARTPWGTTVAWAAVTVTALLVAESSLPLAWAFPDWRLAWVTAWVVAGAGLGTWGRALLERWLLAQRALRALKDERYSDPALPQALGDPPGTDLTPAAVNSLPRQEAADWARAVPALAAVWQQWLTSAMPVRRCDVQRFVDAARRLSGPTGPYAPDEPL